MKRLTGDDWYPISDGWGVVGYGWKCPFCGESNPWEIPEARDTYTCSDCGSKFENDWEE